MKIFVANLSAVEVPKTENEAMTKPEWKAAHMEEIHALEKHGIWEVVEKPKHKATIGCKWVFIIKFNYDRTIERYKARLMAK